MKATYRRVIDASPGPISLTLARSNQASTSSGSKRRRCPSLKYGMRRSATSRRTYRTLTPSRAAVTGTSMSVGGGRLVVTPTTSQVVFSALTQSPRLCSPPPSCPTQVAGWRYSRTSGTDESENAATCGSSGPLTVARMLSKTARRGCRRRRGPATPSLALWGRLTANPER